MVIQNHKALRGSPLNIPRAVWIGFFLIVVVFVKVYVSLPILHSYFLKNVQLWKLFFKLLSHLRTKNMTLNQRLSYYLFNTYTYLLGDRGGAVG